MSSQFRASSPFEFSSDYALPSPRRRRRRQANADASFEGRTLAFSLIAAMVSAEVSASERGVHAGAVDDLAGLPVADSLEDLLSVSALCTEESGGLGGSEHEHGGALNLAGLLGGAHHHGAGGPFASRFADPFGGADEGDHSGAVHGGCARMQMASASDDMNHAHEGMSGGHEGHSAHGAHQGHSGADAAAGDHAAHGEHEDHEEGGEHEHSHEGHGDSASGESGEHEDHLASASAGHAHAHVSTSTASIVHAHSETVAPSSAAITVAAAQTTVSTGGASADNATSTEDASYSSHDSHGAPSIDDVLSDADDGYA
ncbi:MAG TPA: hypothetical protein P5072_14355, partial [Parvularculaceae bacterium]|nr:hypothetical protein [Parvularculaceae bacterium]